MLASHHPRPEKLYLYGDRQRLERALTLGEFVLAPGAEDASRGFLMLRMTHCWDERRFDGGPGHDSCLVIHDAEQFGERIHRAAQKLLPDWTGIDAAVSYGKPSPLGAAFSRSSQMADEKEWLFAWRPITIGTPVKRLVVRIGTVEAIAEIRGKSH